MADATLEKEPRYGTKPYDLSSQLLRAVDEKKEVTLASTTPKDDDTRWETVTAPGDDDDRWEIAKSSDEPLELSTFSQAVVGEFKATGKEVLAQTLEQGAQLNQNVADLITYFQTQRKQDRNFYKNITKSFVPEALQEMDAASIPDELVGDYVKGLFTGSADELQLKASKLRGDKPVPLAREVAALTISLPAAATNFFVDKVFAFPRGYVHTEGSELKKNLKGLEELASRLIWGQFFHKVGTLGSKIKAGLAAAPLRFAETYARFDLPFNEQVKDVGYHMMFAFMAGKTSKYGRAAELHAALGEASRKAGDLKKAGEHAERMIQDLTPDKFTEVNLELNAELMKETAALEDAIRESEPFQTSAQKVKVTKQAKVTEAKEVKAKEKEALKVQKAEKKVQEVKQKELAKADKDVEFPIVKEKVKKVEESTFTEKAEEGVRIEKTETEIREEVKKEQQLQKEMKEKPSFDKRWEDYVDGEEITSEVMRIFGVQKSEVTPELRTTVVEMQHPRVLEAREARLKAKEEVARKSTEVEKALKQDIEVKRLEETLEAQRQAVKKWKETVAKEAHELSIIDKAFKEREVERKKQEVIRTEEQVDIPLTQKEVKSLKTEYQEKVQRGKEGAKFLEEEMEKGEVSKSKISEQETEAKRLADLYDVEYVGKEEYSPGKTWFTFQVPVAKGTMKSSMTLFPETMNAKGFREQLFKTRRAFKEEATQPKEGVRTKAEDVELAKLVKEQKVEEAGDARDVELKGETVEPLYDVFGDKPISVVEAFKRMNEFLDKLGEEGAVDIGRMSESLQTLARTFKDAGKSFPEFRDKVSKLMPKHILDPEVRKLITAVWKNVTEERKDTEALRRTPSDQILKQTPIAKNRSKIPVTLRNFKESVGGIVLDITQPIRTTTYRTRLRTMRWIMDNNPKTEKFLSSVITTIRKGNADVDRERVIMETYLIGLKKKGADTKKATSYVITREIRDGDKHAKATLDIMGLKETEFSDLNKYEQEMVQYGEKIYEQQWHKINKVRKQIGERPLPYKKHYMTFWRAVARSSRDGVNFSDARMEAVDGLTSRVDNVNFSRAQKLKHMKRSKEIAKIEPNYSKALVKYFQTTELYVNTAPTRSLVYELFGKYGKKNTDMELLGKTLGKEDLKTYEPGREYPNVTNFMLDYVDVGAGMRTQKSFLGLPKEVEQILNHYKKNLAVYHLVNPKTYVRQLAAIKNASAYVGRETAYEAFQLWLKDPKMRKRAMESDSLVLRTTDPILQGMYDEGTLSLLQYFYHGKHKEKVNNFVEWHNDIGTKALQKTVGSTDKLAAQISWVMGFVDAQKKGLENPEYHADNLVNNTQASGKRVDRAPIQDTPLGSTVNAFQTFNINNVGYLLYDVMGIGNVRMDKATKYRRTMSWLIQTAIVTAIFEEVIGIYSPEPSPGRAFIHAIANDKPLYQALREGILEAASILPLVGSVKYETAVEGALLGTVNAMGDVIAGKKSMEQGIAITSQLLGVPAGGWFKNMIKQMQRNDDISKIAWGASPTRKGEIDQRRMLTRALLNSFESEDSDHTEINLGGEWEDVKIGE